jgi:hypothetical protein
MNKRVKRLWIKALRSGKYKQGAGFLRQSADGGNGYAYCCLGVLCEIYSKQTGSDGAWNDRVFRTTKGSSSGALPEAVQEWAGIDVPDPLLGRTLMASTLNDKGKSFTFIAGRIEKYL